MAAEGIQEAIAGPVLVRDGGDVSSEIRQYKPEDADRDPGQVRWDPATTAAAFSAIGRTADNRLVALSLTGVYDDVSRGIRQATVADMAQAMIALVALAHKTGSLSALRITRIRYEGETLLLIQA